MFNDTILSRRAGSQRRCIGLAAVMLLIAASAAHAETTVSRTIRDADGNNLLEFGPGESYLVRQELAAAVGGRSSRRVIRLGFAQFTDTHVIDEESPLRVEFLDKFGPPLTSAYRPHEGVTPQVMNEMVRQVRSAVSPVTRRRLELVMTTGDNSDNSQLNEVRNVIDLMDGGIRVNPDSGVPGTCGVTDDDKRYDGVRGGGEYYEPDGSGPPGPASDDGPGYSPDQAENGSEAQRSSQMRDFPSLYEAMNKPFQAIGLGAPWYGIFGNHDALVQGNQPRTEALEALAVGCVKVTELSPAALAAFQALAAGGLTPEEFVQFLGIIQADIDATAQNPGREGGTLAKIVPSDPRRVPLKKAEYIREHFTTRGRPIGHGFTSANLASGMGNFSFKPKPDLRFVVLDSISELGGSDGNIDDTQFRWIHAQLLAAEARRELVMLFAHHSLRTMNQPPASPFPPGDLGGDPSPFVHFGLGAGSSTAPCTIVDPAVPPSPDETLRCLFLRHRSVVAYISGHEHLNRIVPYARDASGDGGFWEVTTASHIDWPQQSRLLDLVDNRDGTLSLFATILDHAGALRVGAVPTGSISGEDVALLAGISREMSFNDPDSDNGEDGRSDARGSRFDRNVELLIRSPYSSRFADDDDNDDDDDDDDDD